MSGVQQNSFHQNMFKPRVTFKKTIFIYAGFCVLFVLGIIMFFVNRNPGLFMMGMSLVCILILLFQTLAPGCYYSIDERGIFAKRWYLKKLFRFEDIRQIKIISSEQVCSEAEKIHSKEVKYMKTTGFKNAYSSRKKLAEFIQFCTVNIVLRETSQGHHLSNTNYRGRPHGQFVVITLKDGSSRLLTPKDPKNFLVTYRSYFRRAA